MSATWLQSPTSGRDSPRKACGIVVRAMAFIPNGACASGCIRFECHRPSCILPYICMWYVDVMHTVQATCNVSNEMYIIRPPNKVCSMASRASCQVAFSVSNRARYECIVRFCECTIVFNTTATAIFQQKCIMTHTTNLTFYCDEP